MVKAKNILIRKASGKKVPFDPGKLRHSLHRSGAAQDEVDRIVKAIEGILFNGITTKEIYKKAFSMLREKASHKAARYKLKKAIMELGPTGFPFEKFVGQILNHQEYKTQVGVIVKGHCVNHEVDVVAEKGNKHFMVECKFHNDQNRHCNVKVPLYIHSRFKDVKKAWQQRPGHENKFHQGWIYTNTRFTTDAIQYGKCANLVLIGWNYPDNNSLNKQIDDTGLHPVTSLTTITEHEKEQLLDKGQVLCRELCNQPKLLNAIGISKKRQKVILEEAHALCNL